MSVIGGVRPEDLLPILVIILILFIIAVRVFTTVLDFPPFGLE